LEGGHSRRLALKGEISKKAFNPIRDTIFLGNQKAYDLTGNVLVFGNIFTVGLTQVTNLINNGHSILRAIGSVTTDYVAMGATSYLGGQLAKEGVYRISKDVYELTEEQSKSNARMAEIFGSLLTGMAVAKPVHNKVMNKFGINDKVPVDKLLKEKPKHSEKFNNWEQMKQAHKRTVTKFVKENKPKGSPI
ncbi:hypothetical protein, partial [Histophilus somni]|uniref:hypothetical protein n=1 Tax=Histophilus somni TaxID=731 RepID=UPI00201F7CF6